jgi:hypothetical protein
VTLNTLSKDVKSMVDNQMVPQFEAQDIPGTDPVTPVVEATPEVVVPVVTPVAPTPAPGSKTDSTLLLASLHEEREKRRKAEEALAALQTQPSYIPDDQYSDEGRALKAEIDRLSGIISQGEAEKQKVALFTQYPQLKDKAEEFEVYRAAKPGYTPEDAAKLFMADQGLLTPTRKGLEKGGTQRGTPSTGEMTPEDTERIRVNEPRRYLKMIADGKINPDTIKY